MPAVLRRLADELCFSFPQGRSGGTWSEPAASKRAGEGYGKRSGKGYQPHRGKSRTVSIGTNTGDDTEDAVVPIGYFDGLPPTGYQPPDAQLPYTPAPRGTFGAAPPDAVPRGTFGAPPADAQQQSKGYEPQKAPARQRKTYHQIKEETKGYKPQAATTAASSGSPWKSTPWRTDTWDDDSSQRKTWNDGEEKWY